MVSALPLVSRQGEDPSGVTDLSRAHWENLVSGWTEALKISCLSCAKVPWPASLALDAIHTVTCKQPYRAAPRLPSCFVFLCPWTQHDTNQPSPSGVADAPGKSRRWGKISSETFPRCHWGNESPQSRAKVVFLFSLGRDTPAVLTDSSPGQSGGGLGATGSHACPNSAFIKLCVTWFLSLLPRLRFFS